MKSSSDILTLSTKSSNSIDKYPSLKVSQIFYYYVLQA